MAVITVKDLRSLIKQGKQQNPALTSRIDAAALIYLTRQIKEESDGKEPIFTVESESEEGTFYEVIGSTCTCSDFIRKRAPANFCKHLLVVLIQSKLKQLLQQREEAEKKAGVRIFEE